MLERAWCFLRSRRAASFLLVYMTVFFILGTLLPYGGPESEAVRKWAARQPDLNRLVQPLGLHDPYASPWFLIPALWLAASTCACAVERTASAARAYRSGGAVSPRQARRLEETPTARFRAPAVSSDPLTDVEAVLRRLRMRVRRGPVVLVAEARRIGLVGSPLFHVALGLLFVFATLGWLTRWEGGMQAVRGRPVVEVESSYLPGWSKGLLFGSGFTGYTFTVTEVLFDYASDGVPIGTAVRVHVRDGPRTVAEGLVHTNRPLRFGRTMVHHLKGRAGLAAVFSIVGTAGVEPLETEVVFKSDPESPTSPEPWSGTLTLAGGGRVPLRIEPRPGQRVSVTLDAYRDAPRKTVLLGVGGSMPLPDGGALTVEDLTRYAEITVVHDWSIPVLYLMFGLASVGVALTVFASHRRVFVKVVAARGSRADGPREFACVVRAQKSDPAFERKVIEAFEAQGFERTD